MKRSIYCPLLVSSLFPTYLTFANETPLLTSATIPQYTAVTKEQITQSVDGLSKTLATRASNNPWGTTYLFGGDVTFQNISSIELKTTPP
ncbi:hypothetical protein [Chlamydia vaughanii]|uniref:hypothetical protein n=1 Tax=Chlamydia vaughanii TaxID=3112552 RepID=UPI0032B1E8D9